MRAVGAPAFMRGKSALALCERVSTLITLPRISCAVWWLRCASAAFLNESRIRYRVQCSVQEIRL